MTPRTKIAPAGKTEPSRKQVPVSFAAYPDEIERWRKAAAALDRTLSWYIRSRVLSADARDEECAAREAHLPKKPTPRIRTDAQQEGA